MARGSQQERGSTTSASCRHWRRSGAGDGFTPKSRTHASWGFSSFWLQAREGAGRGAAGVRAAPAAAGASRMDCKCADEHQAAAAAAERASYAWKLAGASPAAAAIG